MQLLDQLPLLPRPRRLKSANGALKVSSRPTSETNPSVPAIPFGLCADTPGIPAQGYRLAITPKGVRMEAADAAGAFYGRMTLRQLVRLCPDALPCGEIEDSPDIPIRGVMLDISRDKVPTLVCGWRVTDRADCGTACASWKPDGGNAGRPCSLLSTVPDCPFRSAVPAATDGRGILPAWQIVFLAKERFL
ncbi:MAG: glycoside hydrolase family 20 zincin-like fold domain-containing protein [bacterium]